MVVGQIVHVDTILVSIDGETISFAAFLENKLDEIVCLSDLSVIMQSRVSAIYNYILPCMMPRYDFRNIT